MDPKCTHSCKGLCSALELAERKEQEALRLYREYADGCTYPDVREMLDTLIREREHAIAALREKRDILAVKFDTLERINDSFA
jgi:rubrerythrin